MILLSLNTYPVSMTIFWWSWFCGIYSLMLYMLLFLKLMSQSQNIYFVLNLFDVICITTFKDGVTMTI